ncbi:MAG: DNA repair protein RadA, partial [Clostridia bacterium]|nr:DNA repair protein RadA [Clostridia bacterium]
MKGLKTFYVCSECEYKTAKWMGKCPGCGAWNSFVEDVEQIAPTATATPKRVSMIPSSGDNTAVGFNDLEIPTYMRQNTGLHELDRVLGGGLV